MYESKDQNILRSFTHSSKTPKSKDLAFLKKKMLIPFSEGHSQQSVSQNSGLII